MIWYQPSCVVHVVGQVPFLDALYDGVSKVGRSGCVFEVVS
jgi:hypothetical protein